MSEDKRNPMKEIHVSKVVINIGVGKSGDPVEKAKNALSELTGKTPSVRGAKKSVRDFGIHKGEPIGAMVTLRRTDATNFLRRIMESKRNVIKNSSFDNNGNISFGIHEHIDIPGTKYNPDIGIFGMDVCAALTRPGYRISKRRNPSKIGKNHKITKDESIEFFKAQFGVEVN
ncbi:MAG TPA: 50S ribosomal protein L5 [Candidatus Nitrosocosmicus sp.]|jgi:large subunit ribosomal protein L5|nr:50S ribosomal protein L5 [Candidatus Nitrosocosmicus sp.]